MTLLTHTRLTPINLTRFLKAQAVPVSWGLFFKMTILEFIGTTCFSFDDKLGDMERSVALFHLARLYEKTDDHDQAAAAYQHFITDATDAGEGFSDDRDQLSKAYRFLANYHKEKGHFHEAYEYAQKCTEFADTREDGKALLKEISLQRDQGDNANGGANESTDHHDRRDVERVLGENNDGIGSSFATEHRRSPHDDGDESVNATHDLELEPMNLTFTP